MQATRKDVAHIYNKMSPAERVKITRWFAEKMLREALERLSQPPDCATDEELEKVKPEMERMIFEIIEEVFGVKLR